MTETLCAGQFGCAINLSLPTWVEVDWGGGWGWAVTICVLAELNNTVHSLYICLAVSAPLYTCPDVCTASFGQPGLPLDNETSPTFSRSLTKNCGPLPTSPCFAKGPWEKPYFHRRKCHVPASNGRRENLGSPIFPHHISSSFNISIQTS